jgi:peroxiredoxin
MKNRLLLLMLLPLTGFCQQPFSINGKIDKLKKGDKVYLFYLSGGNKLSDSALVSSTSVFKFNGMIDAATAAELSLSKTRYAELNPFLKVPTKEELDRSNFYIEPGTIKISGSNSLNMAVISGTPMNEDNKKLKVMLKPALDKENSVMESMFNLIATKKLDQKGYDEIVIKSVKIAKEQTVIKLSFAEKNLQSRLSLFLLNALTDDPNSYVEAKKTFQKLSPVLKASQLGKSTVQKFVALDKTSIGSFAMDFEQNDVNGNAVKLSDFKGKYVLIDFWSSYCGPCRGESPYLVEANSKYKSKGLNIIGVSKDKDKAAWLKAIADDKLDWTQLCDLTGNNPVAKKYGVTGIPINFLIDPTGKIIAVDLRGAQLGEKLEEVFGK